MKNKGNGIRAHCSWKNLERLKKFERWNVRLWFEYDFGFQNSKERKIISRMPASEERIRVGNRTVCSHFDEQFWHFSESSKSSLAISRQTPRKRPANLRQALDESPTTLANFDNKHVWIFRQQLLQRSADLVWSSSESAIRRPFHMF